MKKNYIKLIGLALLLLLMIGCEKDSFEDESSYVESSNIKMIKISLSNLDSQTAGSIISKIADIRKDHIKKAALNRMEYNDTLGIYIDLDNGRQMEKDGNTWLTFPMYRLEEDKLENVVFKPLEDGSIETYFIKYQITPEQFKTLTDEEKKLLDVDVEKFTVAMFCYSIFIHNYNYECSPPKLMSIEIGTECATITMSGGIGGNPGGGPGSNPNGGPTPGGGGNNPIDIIITTPVTCEDCPEFDPAEIECEKIKKLLKESTNPTLRQELMTLNNKTIELVEYGIYKTAQTSDITHLNSGTAGAVEFPLISGKYVMWAHTHNSPADSTYSLFSWSDLHVLEYHVRSGTIKINEFVFFVMTADGTRYALTISDIGKFKKFWSQKGDSGFTPQIGEKRVNLMYEYYSDRGSFAPNPNPFIVENSNDNIRDEKAFLEFIARGDLGVNIFEINENFDEFTQVKRNVGENQIIKQQCDE